jgi:hypothetical protein
LWIWGKVSTRLCSLRRIARKRHSMETTSCGNGLWCLLDWKMHWPSFSESWTRFSKGHIFLKCYIDDVLVHSKGLLQHLALLKKLFKRLHEVNKKIHPKKCEFVVTSIIYLRHKILPIDMMAHWAKVVSILEMPNHINVHTLRNFIRLCIYYVIYDTFPNSLIDSNESLKWKQQKGKDLGHAP